MRKIHLGKRLIAAVLAAIMLAATLPTAAYAALLDNSPAYNREILDQLKQIVGSEEEAQTYYELLQRYDLLDEDGDLVTSWDIRMDGADITLEQLRTVLAGDYDPDQYISVDGTMITLKDVATILEIEDYLAYLRETYFDGRQWTAEQQNSLRSLMAQIQDEGISLVPAAQDLTGASGVNHAARVSITGPEVSGTSAVYTATLTNAGPEQTVTFQWAAQSGSQPVSGGGTVTLTQDQPTAELAVTLGSVTTDTVRSTAQLAYYLKLDGIANALFSNDETAMSVLCRGDKTISGLPGGTFSITGTTTVENQGQDNWGNPIQKNTPATVTLTADQHNAIAWGIANNAQISTTYATDANSLLVYSSDRTTATAYRVAIAAQSGSYTLASASYGQEYAQGSFSYVKDETHRTNTALSGGEIGSQITLSSTSNYVTYNKLSDGGGWGTVQSGVLFPVTISLAFSDTGAPVYQSASAPEGTYYPGQVVPVTVTFSEPVDLSSVQVKFNGEEDALSPVESSGVSNVVTIPYLVQQADNQTLAISSVTARDSSGHALSAYNPGGDTVTGKPVDGVTLDTPNKTDVIAQAAAQVAGTASAPELKVDVTISSDEKVSAWLAGSMEAVDGRFQTKTDALFVSLDGGKTKYPLVFPGEAITGQTGTATIPLAVNDTDSAITHVAELYVDGALVVGKAAAAVQNAAQYITAADLSAALSIQKDGQDYPFENGEDPVVYLQGGDLSIQASFTLSGSGYTYGDTSSVAVSGTEQADTADFVWSSSDPTVAKIDEGGRVTPTGKAGSTEITLTARNGGVEGKAASVTAVYTVEGKQYESLRFAAGLTPFLQIPQKSLSAEDGQPVTIYWTSNLCEKNGETPTEFAVTVMKDGREVYATTVTGTAAAPAGSVTIPGDKLEYDYAGGSDNTFAVTVSAVYGGQTYSDTASIGLEAKPALVSLGKLDSYYITDQTRTVPISWSVEHLDRRGTAAEDEVFRFQITCNSQDVDTSAVTLGSETAGGSYSGTYQLNIGDIKASDSDPSSYRQVYTVTLQAKNGADSTWSYDSFLLYVYDADALQIMVDGQAAGDSLTMSNRSEISQMSQDQILALKRDIYLKDIISVNYGQYAWTEVADQIAWASSDNAVASINYRQGTLYEDIQDFSYVSYRPTEDFLLSGKADGQTTITATHKLTGMQDSLNVTVDTLKDSLYLFQCYPQATTALTFREYTNATHTTTKETTIYSDETGAAAYYAPYGIASDVYCQTKDRQGTITGPEGNLYAGTFYRSELKTGEQDAAAMTLYPCNNLKLRRAAYAYVYVKNPDGTAYTGDITFRGGVYVNGEYQKDALFQLNSHNAVNQKGYEDQRVSLGQDGKLTVVMDQQQWGLADNTLTEGDAVEYVFQIERADSFDYYPILFTIDAAANEDEYVDSGNAVVNFRSNPEKKAHPFIVQQISVTPNYGTPTSLLEYTGKIGPSDSCPETDLTTVVMWWGEEKAENPANRLQLKTKAGVNVADQEGKSSQNNQAYPFCDNVLTYYTVQLDQETMDAQQGGLLNFGESTGLTLEYYRDGSTLTCQEDLPFQLCQMLGQGLIENQQEIGEMLGTMGQAAGTDAQTDMSLDDMFVQAALNLVSSDSYTTGNKKLFSIQLAPTSDPTKFLGFIQVNVGNMENNVTGIYADSQNRKEDMSYAPGLSEMMMLTTLKSPTQYAMGQLDDFNKVLKRKGVRSFNFQMGGYAESMIYYNSNTKKWEIQILDGGFNAGGGLNYTWNWNMMVGPVPITGSLAVGGTAEVSMDALSVSYWKESEPGSGSYTSNLGNDFLTELRIYLYLKAFAGVGFDYSIVALKMGIYGQINMDMQFQWLNRPYMDSDSKVINAADGTSNQDAGGYNLNGQRIKIDGQIGLEFFVKFLFFSYEKILYSQNFNLLDAKTGDWVQIQDRWSKNQTAMQDSIEELLNGKNATLTNFGGQQMLALELAPTMESRDYLSSGDFARKWGTGGISLFSLDREQGLKNLESNTYPYANPEVSDDGSLVAYLSDMDSTDPADTRAAFALKSGSTYRKGGAIDDQGYGDSQLSLSGTGEFAVAAWTRQTAGVDKDQGAALTTDDQMIMMNSSEVCAAVYDGSKWSTTQLSTNGAPDLAPVSATNGQRAIVFWRAVSSSGTGGAVTDFDQKDTIVYRIYDGSAWGETHTLYNGTSGSVKGITAAMLDDGTAAVAYTLSTGGEVTGQEIVYAVVDKDGSVVRNVQATNDAYLDENPQLAAVDFGEKGQRFVLGWYTEQSVSSDSAGVLDSGSAAAAGNETTSDIRLLDFDSAGVSGQLLPDSISQAADAYGVSITSDFRFVKHAGSIENLSILWVERAQGDTAALDESGQGGSQSDNTDLSGLGTEKDVLKGVKFYRTGDTVRFTGAVDIAEMPDATLIDHFDAYVSDPASNQVKAVILGTTYGSGGTDGTVTRTVTLADGVTQAQVTTPTQTTAMYTATETYQDKIEVPAVLADYDTIYPGGTTQIQFTVENQGIHVIDGLTIQVGDTTTQTDTVLLPGQTVQVTADYAVPADGVVDPAYTVTANFTDEGASGTAETGASSGFLGIGSKAGSNVAQGTVYLDLPNLQITDSKIVSEENGVRTIQVKLNNTLAASLNKKGRAVRVGFYSDATCETPIEGLQPVTIQDGDSLSMIDEGGYSFQVNFDVGQYLKKDDGTVQEIPDSGVTVYIKAEVVETEQGNETVLGEPTISDNYASVTCDNLRERTGQDAILTTALSNEDGRSTVTVNLQNTSLTQTTTGNLVVTLLDENGQVVEQQQSYTGKAGDNGLITLGGEEKTQRTFQFAHSGTDVYVTYSDLILDQASADLASLRISELPGITLDSFAWNGDTNQYECTVSAENLTSATVMASAESPTAAIALSTDEGAGADGQTGGNILNRTVGLTPGRDTAITLTVTDGAEKQVYVLHVKNSAPAGGGGSSVSYAVVPPAQVDHGTVTVTPKRAGSGQTVTITAKADEGYQVDRVTVTGTDGKTVAVQDKGGGVYTFTMPAGNVAVDVTFKAADGWANPFSDVAAGTWYYDAVRYVSENGVMNGYDTGLFGPEDGLTRSQLAQILYNLEGRPSLDQENLGYPFADVPGDAWFADAVYWARLHGIVTGYSGEQFGPDDPITREQLAVMLYRYAQYKSYDTGAQGDLDAFPDESDVMSWSEQAVTWAVSHGLITGTGDGKLAPQGNASRAQVAAILMRFAQNVVQ